LDGQRPPGVSVFHEEVIVLGEQPAHARIADIAVFRTRPGDDGLSNNTPASDVLLVVEIEGPSTRRADRWEKPAEYSEAGIPSYWRIETDPRVVCHTYRLINGAYQPGGRYRLGDVIRDANLDWIGVRLGL
jgi:Uma2 family endonuclease